MGFARPAGAVNALIDPRLSNRPGRTNITPSMSAAPFELIRPGAPGNSPLLLMCDHASNALPPGYGTLGIEPSLFATHIAYDIGAGVVTRALAAALGAPAVLGAWSRLLIDLNRGVDDPTLIMKLSDGSIVPGNRDLGETETARRIAHFHVPYHAAVTTQIESMPAVPVLVSVHSFTPHWKGRARVWEVGVLWDRDGRLARPLIGRLEKAGFCVGDNEPYSGSLENDCLYRHGTIRGLPHALIEIRQDLIADDDAARAFSARMKPILEAALRDMGRPEIRFTRPLSRQEGEMQMDKRLRETIEATVFRRLVAHLRSRTDVQNIDLMTLAGFCRNCLGDWYREAAAEKGIALEEDVARAFVYGMAPAVWKEKCQKDVTPEQAAAFVDSQKAHS
jgi:predicted N-formylglutamate amidohydrolase